MHEKVEEIHSHLAAVKKILDETPEDAPVKQIGPTISQLLGHVESLDVAAAGVAGGRGGPC